MLPLFIYGTLHPDRATREIAATTRLLRSIGRATIRGRRFDLGEYPGVILSDDPKDIVLGELFSLPPTPEAFEILARLDAYEDYRPDDPENSLFLRRATSSTMENGTRRQCWVYSYNLPVR